MRKTTTLTASALLLLTGSAGFPTAALAADCTTHVKRIMLRIADQRIEINGDGIVMLYNKDNPAVLNALIIDSMNTSNVSTYTTSSSFCNGAVIDGVKL